MFVSTAPILPSWLDNGRLRELIWSHHFDFLTHSVHIFILPSGHTGWTIMSDGIAKNFCSFPRSSCSSEVPHFHPPFLLLTVRDANVVRSWDCLTRGLICSSMTRSELAQVSIRPHRQRTCPKGRCPMHCIHWTFFHAFHEVKSFNVALLFNVFLHNLFHLLETILASVLVCMLISGPVLLSVK